MPALHFLIIDENIISFTIIFFDIFLAELIEKLWMPALKNLLMQ